MRRRYLHFTVVILGCFVVCGLATQSSFGLVNTNPHSGYNSAPSDDPGWDYVGKMSIGSGVYLGDGWVLTPYHVYEWQHQVDGNGDLLSGRTGYAHFDLDQRYNEILGTAHRIKYDATTDADLVMFRIEGNPNPYPDANGAPTLVKIREDALATEDDIGGLETARIIAIGRTRAPDPDPAPESFPPLTWTIDGKTYYGYDTVGTRLKQWGTNEIEAYPYAVTPSGESSKTDALLSVFDRYIDPETQPVNNDSGGAAFTDRDPSYNNSEWELTGMIFAIAAEEGFPYSQLSLKTHAVYGTAAFYVDLMAYSDQIAEIRDIRLDGDADRNGKVDLGDFAILRATFGLSASEIDPYFNANFNDDDFVDVLDLEIFKNNFGIVSGGYNRPDLYEGDPPVFAPVAAPEPATVFVLIGAVPMLVRSKRRRRACSAIS